MYHDDMKCNEELDSNGYDDTSPVATRALYTILTAQLANVSVTIARIEESTHEARIEESTHEARIEESTHEARIEESTYKARMYNHYTCVESRVAVKKIKAKKFNEFILYGLFLVDDLIGTFPSRVWENSKRFKFCPEQVLLFPSVVGMIENMSPDDEIAVVSQLYSCSLDNLDINNIQYVDIFSKLPNLVEQLNLLHKHGFVHNDVKVKNVYCNIFSTKIDENGLPVYKVSFHLGNFKNCYMGHNKQNGMFEDGNDIRGIGHIILFLIEKVGIQKNPMLTPLYDRLFVIAKQISQCGSFNNERWTLDNITAMLRQFCYKINN
jgi:serine/threonine protein kinase